ncbi:MAG TPA: SHOCT domain-containing protein [Candidatus Borkfalkia excrementavium]|uniref:SHOCT domain-containing protein n=1 Tax=Candidatus Borkfalkia excrementavium TaxID=2838505 RepID=A0A9D1Z866_9FIRM|nr:SHOCT domain-containing protein [Candidatus Borkfalkia excrementavium]
MRISIKTLACGVAAFVVGLIALVGLTSALSSVEALGLKLSENGFDVFDFKSTFLEGSNREWAVYVAGAISIISCIAGVVTLVLGGLSALFKKFEGAAKKMMIVSLICTLLYMVAGIIYNLQVKAIGGDGSDYVTVTYTTSAFLPFIFAVIFTVAYFVCAKLVPDIYIYGVRNQADEAALAQKAAAKQAREEIAAASAAPYTAPAQPAQPAADAPMSDERRVELLAKYSQLLKDGAITQEEFDEKKKELLSK